MSKLFLPYLVCLAIIFSCHSSWGNGVNPNNASIQDAHNAYFQMDHEKAYRIFENVWEDEGQKVRDRASAGRTLARMDWLFYQNNTKAHERLEALSRLNESQSALYNLKARILEDEQRYDEAIVASRKAYELSSSNTEKYSAMLRFCGIVLSRYQDEEGGTKPAEDKDLKEAFEYLSTKNSEEGGDVDVARLYLGTSLLLKKGEDVYKAWMSFYRLTEPDQVHPSLLADVEGFRKNLKKYKGKVKGNTAIRLIKDLAESGFYDYAVMLKRLEFGASDSGDQRVEEIVRYHRFLDEIGQLTLDFYLETVKKSQDKTAYQQAMRGEAEKFWADLQWTGEAPEFSDLPFVQEMEKRFKAIVTFINANGHYGLHMGHIVLDDRRLIDQHNESAEFRYIAIDHMVSNGYSGWFWDGAAESGGWAGNDGSFLQVRSAYTSGPVKAWQMVTDPVEVERVESQIEALRNADDSLARVNPHAYLPGLGLRLSYNQRSALLKSLKDKGLSGGNLRLAFINNIERIVQGASIYAHEGRHAIDKKNNYSRSSPELEFTAKLSEIYFSEMPFLSFTAILSRNIGDRSSHGQANLRVIKGLVEWMDKRKDKIAGFDKSRPTLSQMDKLTEAQLREAMKSYDPMAK